MREIKAYLDGFFKEIKLHTKSMLNANAPGLVDGVAKKKTE